MTRTIGIGVINAGRHHTKAIEASQFLASVDSGVQGDPGLREALAFAHVQETTIRLRESRRWELEAYEGVTT